MILCNDFVVNEQITPITQSRKIASSTVCSAVLKLISASFPLPLDRQNSRRESISFSIKFGVHAGTSQHHLRYCVCNARCPSGLSNEVAPTHNPGPDGDMFLGNHVLCHEIHPPRCWICRYQLRDWGLNRLSTLRQKKYAEMVGPT